VAAGLLSIGSGWTGSGPIQVCPAWLPKAKCWLTLFFFLLHLLLSSPIRYLVKMIDFWYNISSVFQHG
jgi:hypothetical protein